MVFTDDTVYIMAHKAYLRSLNPHILNEDNHDLPYVKWIGYNYEPNVRRIFSFPFNSQIQFHDT